MLPSLHSLPLLTWLARLPHLDTDATMALLFLLFILALDVLAPHYGVDTTDSARS